jgi:L-threonylcarbamoyladenylate synthase
VSTRYDLSDPPGREAGIAAAVTAVRRGLLVVLPTDTVYGVGVDAFDADAVQRLLDAKGRGRDMPPPVLISATTTLDALATDLPGWAAGLTEHYWPGPLTIVCRQQPSLRWDLGDARGTVAVRMPDHEAALELLGRTGPLAVSSANLSGQPAATDVAAAEQMLGHAVEVILDGGPSAGSAASTIVDCTGTQPRILREGAISAAALAAVLQGLGAELEGGPSPDPGPEPGPGPSSDPNSQTGPEGGSPRA